MRARYGLPDIALLDMGDFAGGLLKYLRDHPIPKLTIAGGFGKLTQACAGRARPPLVALGGGPRISSPALRESAGASAELIAAIAAANTAAEALSLADTERGAARPARRRARRGRRRRRCSARPPSRSTCSSSIATDSVLAETGHG